jgi:uncharacterized membrane protein YjfL (UPF0719 family)
MLVPLALGIATVVALLLVDLATERLRAAAPRPPLVRAAHVFGVFLLAGAVVRGAWEGDEGGANLLWLCTFGAVGWVGLTAAEAIGLRALPGLLPAARDHNPAAETAAAAHVAAVGILLANVCGGTSFDELLVGAGSFAIGQVSLLLLVVLFRLLTGYDDRRAIVGGNLAAALSHGGLTLALALLIAHATDGPWQGLVPALRDYGIALAEGLCVYPVRQVVVQGLILRTRPRLFGGELDRAIGERGDIGIGALEAATYLGTVLLVRSFA